VRRAALLLLATAALAGCGGGGEAGAPMPATQPAGDGVEELANVLDLRSAFEADAGKTRVLLTFSPT
jgi:ABC-type glycerol-3-phosphate transport system substrate-binding protein